MKHHLIWPAFIGMMITASLAAQERDAAPTREAMIARALEYNPGIRAARSNAGSLRSLAKGATAWQDPQFAFEFFATPITSLNPIADGMENDYSVSQMFMFPGKLSLMGDMAQSRTRMAEEDARGVSLDIVAQVKSAYAMLFAAQRRLAINAGQDSTVRSIIEVARARFAVAQASQADMSRLEVEALQVRNERTRLEYERASAEAMLRALKALPPGATVAPLAPPPLAPPGGIDETSDTAITRNPSIRGMRFDLEMRRADFALAKREWLPDLMIRGMYKQMAMGQTDQWALMFGINVPIAPWSGGRYAARRESTELAIRSAEERLDEMNAMVRYEVRNGVARCASLWEQLARYRESILPRANESLEGQLARFRTDQAGLLGLLDSWRMVRMYAMDEVMLAAEYAQAQAKLEQVMGDMQ